MEENEFWALIWRFIIVGAVLIGMTIAGCDSYQTKLFIEHGYNREMLPGNQNPSWTKGEK